MKWPLLVLVISCGTAARREAKMQDEIAAAWKGHSVAELKDHTYLQTLKASASGGKLTFTKQTEFNSKARCAAMGGCTSFFNEGCAHTFFIKEDKVTAYTNQGDCYVDMEWLLKRSPKVE